MKLHSLSLTNIAVFDQQMLDWPGGLTVLAGEAGAGKSLLLEGIAWALGAPLAAKTVLRSGETQGRIELTVACDLKEPQSELSLWLTEQGLADEQPNQVVFSRELTRSGSRCRVNGTLVNRTALDSLREAVLVNVSQHAGVELFRPAKQRDALDRLGGKAFQGLKGQVSEQFLAWQQLQRALEQAELERAERASRLELLQFQQQELTQANLLDTGEDEQLRAERNRLQNAEGLNKLLEEARSTLKGYSSGWNNSGGPGLQDLLDRVEKALSNAVQLDKQLSTEHELFYDLREQLSQLAQRLGSLQRDVKGDPQRLNEVAERLDLLEKLKRKYGPSLADVFQRFEQIDAELAELTQYEDSQAALEAEYRAAETNLKTSLAELTQQRAALAQQLEQTITPLLQQMALPKAKLTVRQTEASWTENGADHIEFLFTANAGEELKPLGSVASGGELSRVLLALTVMSASPEHPKLYIFDEVDTGTSGQAAQTIAQQLVQLASQGHSVLVITHQPIVAAAGDQILSVRKETQGSGSSARTATQVALLTEASDKQALLSQLASGQDVQSDDERVTRFAERLVEEANRWKQEAGVG